MKKPPFESLKGYERLSKTEMSQRAEQFYRHMKLRRTVREYSSDDVSRDIIENCIRAAGTAPSGANLQPWHFVVVTDQELKRQIRIAAEEEERAFYEERAPQEWLDALRPFDTDENKPFLETAPCLIAIFEQKYGIKEDGTHCKHYYSNESTGIATGLLITALHRAGLVTLTHTPSPMKFLNQVLDRPRNEKPFLLLVVGYPAKDVQVPMIRRKTLSEIATFK